MLRRYSLRQVSLGGLGLLGTVACAGMLGLTLAADSMRRETERHAQQLREDEVTASRVVYHVSRQLDAAYRYADTRQPEQRERFRQEGQLAYDQIRAYLFRDLGPEERLLVEHIREAHEQIEVAAQRAFALPSGTHADLPEASTLERDLARLMDLRVAQHEAALAQQRVLWRWLYIFCAGLALLFIAMVFATATFLRRRLLEPLGALSQATRSVGGGDFFTRVEVDGDDELASVAYNFNRMTERLNTARVEMRASEERYHSLFDRVPVGLYRTTVDGRFIEANQALVRTLGFESREALLATSALDLYMDAEDRRRWQHSLHGARGVVEVDREQRRRDGSMIWVREMAQCIRDDDGNVLYYEGAIKDVTERVHAVGAMRNSEARFRSLVENASEGVLVVSSAGELDYHSPAIERILGYAPDGIVAADALLLIHPEDRDDVWRAFVELMSHSGEAVSVEFRCRDHVGQWRVLHAIGTNLVHDPAVGGYVVNMIDLTQHRRLEEQLQHSLKMEAVGRLAGGIAHDFNNLLTAIQGYTELLAARTDELTGARQEVDEIRRAVERAARLTRQLLAFSRRQVVRRRPTDVGAVIRELEQMLTRVISEDTRVETLVADGCWVHADAGQLEQVIMNLVVNASDAGPHSAIRITVEAVTLRDDDISSLAGGEYVLIMVQDDGCGIPADALPHIFEPFFTTKDVGKGTGLGLATVYGIIRESGGVVIADSEYGAGTTVRAYLPRIVPPATSLLAPPPEPAPEAPEHGAVLLVEDEPAVRSIAERVLRRQGYTVHTAANGAEALELLRGLDGRLDLLVTDVVMPVMGGVQLARELARHRPGLRVLFMSGYAADDLPVRSDGLPARFLEKPFSPAELTQAVRDALVEPVATR